jgi:hypothetical protein
VSRDLVAEEARGWPGTVLDVPMNCEHGEGTDRGCMSDDPEMRAVIP